MKQEYEKDFDADVDTLVSQLKDQLEITRSQMNHQLDTEKQHEQAHKIALVFIQLTTCLREHKSLKEELETLKSLVKGISILCESLSTVSDETAQSGVYTLSELRTKYELAVNQARKYQPTGPKEVAYKILDSIRGTILSNQKKKTTQNKQEMSLVGQNITLIKATYN